MDAVFFILFFQCLRRGSAGKTTAVSIEIPLTFSTNVQNTRNRKPNHPKTRQKYNHCTSSLFYNSFLCLPDNNIFTLETKETSNYPEKIKELIMTAATATSSNRRPLHQQQQQSDLYMKIVCDPGHERTTRELRDLPRESRERVWADMVGSDHSSSSSSSQSSSEHSHDAEDPMFVSKVLNLMDDELSHLSCEDNKVDSKAWEYALQNTQLAHDPTFRLMFLRAEEYDPTRAAIRVIRHFDHKAMLFGKDKLDQTIRLSDLNGDDLESLSCGGFQFLPVADRGGRLVFMSRYRCFVYKERANMVRCPRVLTIIWA